MDNPTRHILLPTLAPLLFFALAATPVELLGCRNRGLLALAIAFISLLGALYAAARSAGCRARRDPQGTWWLYSSLILAVPPVALIFLA